MDEIVLKVVNDWTIEIRRGKDKENGEKGHLYACVCRKGQPISLIQSNDRSALKIMLQDLEDYLNA